MPYVKGVGYVPVGRAGRPETTTDECIAALRRLASEIGRTPKTVDVNECLYTPSYPTYLRIFGSFPEAQRAAGLATTVRAGNLSPSEKTFLDSRQMAMVSLFKDGATMDQIGKVYGVTRERVRQVIRVSGFKENPRRVDPLRIIKSARKAFTLWQVCSETGYSAEIVTECLTHLGHLVALNRLWEWRKKRRIHAGRKYSDFELLRRLRALAAELGHTPGIVDINSAPEFPRHTVYTMRFGSIAKAQRLAGLIPNRTGKPASRLPVDLQDRRIAKLT